jgi:hypothetical protein
MARRTWFGLLGLAVALGLVLPGVAIATSQSAAATVCEQTWGSLPKTAGSMSVSPVTNVRSGQHTCVDRLVVDLAGPVAGYDVRYVNQVYADGSGQLIPLRGGAKLQVVVYAPSYDENGNSTYNPANPRELVNVAGYRTFRQVASAGSFEGMTTFGLGVRARLPFTVYTLNGPGTSSRIVVDVAHQW